MLSRKNCEESPTNLPSDSHTEIIELLTSIYGDQCSEKGKKIELCSEIYPSEIVLAITMANQLDPGALATTYIVSTDVDQKSNPRDLINKMVDSIGTFIESYFQHELWDEYQTVWETTSIKNCTFYFRITRENLALSIMADKLLNENPE